MVEDTLRYEIEAAAILTRPLFLGNLAEAEDIVADARKELHRCQQVENDLNDEWVTTRRPKPNG